MRLHILHLFGDCIGPKSISIFLDEGICLCNIMAHLNAKLVHLFQELHTPFLNQCNDMFAFVQHDIYPPFESWFIVDALRDCIICNSKWVHLLQVLEGLPGGGPVLPLDAEVSSRSGEMQWIASPMDHTLSVFGHIFVIGCMVDKQVHHEVLVALIVA